ncbi:MAG: GIY-YIG nuclease family protein [Gammaproteobacteria bacterium]|nr:GIY-YIG nuclease family protein [Gammaproteobacteria bacterium]
MHYVYKLQSLSHPNQIYTGCTNDLKRRLTEHNLGKSPHTKKYCPWKLTLYLAFPEKQKVEERRFRTVLKNAAKQPPNFAGNMIVATWGCGIDCRSFAIINAQTGKVWFPDFGMTSAPIDHPKYKGRLGYYYWKNSNLFVAIGSQGFGAVPGVYYYLWTGKELNLLQTEMN